MRQLPYNRILVAPDNIEEMYSICPYIIKIPEYRIEALHWCEDNSTKLWGLPFGKYEYCFESKADAGLFKILWS